MVPANRSLSTFDKIPRVCSVESLASDGLVSGKGVQVGNSFARKVDSAPESSQPIFLATLRLVFDRTLRYSKCGLSLSILRSSSSYSSNALDSRPCLAPVLNMTDLNAFLIPVSQSMR